MAKKTIYMFLFIPLLGLSACKKDKSGLPSQKLNAKVVCADCYWTVQNGKAVIASKFRGNYDESVDFNVHSGDTILFAGYNYSASKNMDGYLIKSGKEISHKTTHCGGNPTFFMEYIVP